MTDSRKPDMHGPDLPPAMKRSFVRAVEYAIQTIYTDHNETNGVADLRWLREWLTSPVVARSPAQPSPEQERDVDELLEDFQRACERCVSHLASDEGYARTDAKNRAILRNELRSRLLSVVSPPADTGKET